MGLHLVTGHAGYEHITPADHGAFHNALLLSGNCVLNSGNKFSATVVTSNSIKISDGELIMQGRHVRLKPGEYEEVTIENGTQDSKRNDLIVARYVKNGTTGIETVSFVTIKGTPGVTATDPAYIEGNILNGVLTADFPLYRVPLDGLNVGKLVPLFEVKDSFDKRISDIVSGTSQVGNAKTLDGHEAEYFAPAEGLNSIQSTSKATLSTAGWYRVAEYTGGAVNGTDSNSCVLSIKQRHGSGNGESHVLRLMSVSAGHQTIVSIASKCRNSVVSDRTVTKARYTYDTDKAYLEIYYPQSVNNIISFTISDGTDGRGQWQAVTPTLTAETVEGVTVTTTYDIPANARPVTNLDDPNLNGYKELTSGFDLNNALGKYRTTSSSIIGSLLNKPTELSNGEMEIEWYPFMSANNLYGMQVIRAYHTATGKAEIFFRIHSGGSNWTKWDNIATTADLATELAKYLPLTGGRIDGSVSLYIEDTSKYIAYYAVNALRKFELGIATNGDIKFHDSTNGKTIINSKLDGTNTFNGTATGNLPSSGGTVKNLNVERNSDSLLVLKNTTEGATGAYTVLRAVGVDGEVYIGMDNGIPRVGGKNGWGDILHTGNSAKVWTEASTPPDTSYVHIY